LEGDDPMDDNLWVYEMTSKLIGIIFKKSLLENSMEKVYGKVFRDMATKIFEDDVHILEIFGDVGG
jgi:hypothetical protein